MAIVGSGLTRRGGRLLPVFGGVAGPTNLPNYRAALAAAKAGTTGPLIINVIGDSTVAGTGGGNPASAIGNNARGNSIAQQLGDLFAASGLPKNGADIFASNLPVTTTTATDYAGFNTSVTPGSWTLSTTTTLASLGGNMWNSAASGANFSWTAEGRPFDKLVVYYAKNSGLGTFKVLIDGVDQGNIATAAGSQGYGRTAFSVSVGVHTVQLQWVSGSCYVDALETVDTTTKASVRIRNMGRGSATSADIVSTATGWASGSALAIVDAAKLHIIQGGQVNDWLTGAGTSVHASNLTALMSILQPGGGDVLLLGSTRSDPTSTAISLATQDSYVAAMAALANGTTKAFYDVKTSVGDYSTMNGAGRMFDNKHPNYLGYAAEAAAVYGAIT